MTDSEETKDCKNKKDPFIFDLTEDHFKKWVFYCKEWISILGLTEWRINYIFCSEDEDDCVKGTLGRVAYNTCGMCATVYLNKKWERIYPDDFSLRSQSFHEICEILLAPLVILTESRFNVYESDIEYETHRVIRRLENVLTANIRSAEN